MHHVSLFSIYQFDTSSFSAAAVKEKRDLSVKSALPPRPPTRRGRTGNSDSMDAMSSVRPQALLMRARLRHASLPGQDLPHSMSLSQLLHYLV